MAKPRPTPTDKTHLVSLICRINDAIRELESYLAEQRDLSRQTQVPGIEMARTSRRQSTDKPALM